MEKKEYDWDKTQKKVKKELEDKYQNEIKESFDKKIIYNFWQCQNITDKAKLVIIKYPLFYDKSNIWYFYSDKEKKWEICDETDIISSIKFFFEMSNLSQGKYRSEMLNALKDEARKNRPNQLDHNWLQFGKDIYNLSTSERQKMSSKYFSLIKIPHSLGYSVETPIIDKHIISWVGEEQYNLFVQICAYAMLKDYPFARFFIFYGTGQDGKSTAGNFISRLIGSENTCNVDIDQLNQNRFESQKLYQKTLAICGEVDYKLLKNTRKLKGVTGNDPMTIEFKNKNPFEYRNFAKLLWYANGIPPTYDKTQGFYRRTIIIKFPNKFSEKCNPLDDITEKEYENFCLKCTKVLEDLVKNGFDEKTLDEKQKEYEELSNPVLKFLNENIEEGSEIDYIDVVELFNVYNGFAKKNGYRNFNYNDFSSMLRAEDYEIKRQRFYERNTGEYDLNKNIDYKYTEKDIRRKVIFSYKLILGIAGTTGTAVFTQSLPKGTNSKQLSQLSHNPKDSVIISKSLLLSVLENNEMLSSLQIIEKLGIKTTDEKLKLYDFLMDFSKKGLIFQPKMNYWQLL